MNIKNEWLETYEIKKPDYDYIDRGDVADINTTQAPLRYKMVNGHWKSIKRPKLFGEKTARLMFVGDITCFEKQFEEAKTKSGYNFNYAFRKVRDIFKQADLVVGNLETMIFPNAPYRTEKYVSEQNYHCNAPVEFLEAVRGAGFDVLTNANNHALDTGVVGLGETIDHIERYGFIHTGTFKSDKKRYEIIDVRGFKVGIIAFATNFNNKECNLTARGMNYLLNEYNDDKAKMLINEARRDGAELVFACIHWGSENKTEHNEKQTVIATELVNAGYDCIIGSHPHVLQPFTIMETTRKKVPVFYSLGNFISHNANNQKSRSLIACVDLKRKNGKVTMECSYIPIFTSDNFGKKKYTVIPLEENPKSKRNKSKVERIKKVVGDEIAINSDVNFVEWIEKKTPTKAVDIEKIDLAKVSKYPVTYDNGIYKFSIYEDYAVIDGFSDIKMSLSYSVPEKILGVPVTAIREGAFAENSTIKKMNFRKNIDEVGKGLFKNSTALEGFQLGRNTYKICEEAFSGCTGLTSAVMKDCVEIIESKAFYNCTNLRSVKIPYTVFRIADDAFEGCDNAVFYCEVGCYADKYLRRKGFNVVNMDLS